uniref:Ig-like domain-containing protein n=1 Tax=Oreochromis niloticus TaxID=8128 RepID=A0A669D214_ORENI
FKGKYPGLSLKHTIFCLKPLTSLLCIVSLSDITAESGQDVILTCRAPNNNIQTVEWSRADLGDEYVFLYRDELFVTENQHPSFKNRVDLQDRQMKDGDVSLILKNVTINDTGTYECSVKTKTNRRKRANLDNNIISMISLSVVTGGHTEGDCVVLIACLLVSGVFVVAAVAGFVIYRNHKKAKEVLTKLLNSSKYLRPLIIKQSPAAVPTSQCCQ